MRILIVLFFFVAASFLLHSQDNTAQKDSVYTVITYNGGEFTGKLISRDSKEITIETEDRGEVTIPMYEVKEIFMHGDEKKTFFASYDKRYEKFAKSYLYTSNAHSLPKGENYIAFNWWGPDVQFGVTDNFDIGVMTTWYSMPVALNFNYSIPVSETFRIGLGTNIGAANWLDFSQGLIFFPKASFTFGGYQNNFNISVGYPNVTVFDYEGGNIFFSVGGMREINDKWSFVVESWLLPIDDELFGILIPGVRFYTSKNNAWQFGFAAGFGGGFSSVIPLPTLQYMWNM